jgi:exopolysaccharide biosynthesis operon protein EpsL
MDYWIAPIANAWRVLRVAACLAGALAPPEAAALWGDRLELFAAQAVTRDDNIFRLAPGSDALLGIPGLDDTYRSSSLGIKLDVPFSRQRVQGGLEVSRVRYERFSELDFDGHDGRALWEWGLGDDLKGKLGFSQRRALASLASVQEGVRRSIKNVLTTRHAFAAGEALLTPSWQLQLEASRLEHSNEAEARLPNDLVLDRGEASLSYLSRAGNRLGLRGRLARGTLPNPQLVGSVPVDNSYRQREAGAVAVWSPGGHSRLRAHASRVRRVYVERPQRDFDGRTYELAFDWALTGKLAIAAIAQRDISATEEIHVSFVLAERVALNLSYRPSTRTELSALLETSDRRYLGEAGQAQGTVRRERLRAAGLSAAYRPLPQVTLQLSLRRETRSADVAFGDYAANIVSLGVRFGL